MVLLKHHTTATGANNPGKQISVDRWNEGHDLTGTAYGGIRFNASGIAADIPDSVCPEMFGAAGDYDPTTNTGTDDSAAFLAMVNYCMSRGGGAAYSVRLNAKHYLITTNNVFGKWTTNPGLISGWSIHGAGMNASRITFRPTGTDGVTEYYLHDGLAASGIVSQTNVLFNFSLTGAQINLDARNLSTQSVGWFRQSGWTADASPEQGWHFGRVFFYGDEAHLARMGTILRIVGEANGSENEFVACRGWFAQHVVHCTNAQAVNHASLACHWELIVGDMFLYTRGGGLTVTGGSIIMDNINAVTGWTALAVVAAGATRYYDGRKYTTVAGGTCGSTPLTHVVGSASDGGVTWAYSADESMYVLSVGGDVSGQGNDFLISGVRIELRTNRAKILTGGDLNTNSSVTFSACNCQAVVGGYRTTFKLAESGLNVEIHGGDWAPPGGYDQPLVAAFGAASDAAYRQRAAGGVKLLISGAARVHKTIHDLFTWGTYSTAVVEIGDSVVCDAVADLTTDTQRFEAPDLLLACVLTDPLGPGFGAKGSRSTKKRRKFRVNFYNFPSGADVNNPTGLRSQIKLPPGAVIDASRVFKTNVGGNAVAVTYKIQRSSDSSVVATFGAIASFAAGFDQSVSAIGYTVSGANRTFKLLDTGANDAGHVEPSSDSYWELEVIC